MFSGYHLCYRGQEDDGVGVTTRFQPFPVQPKDTTATLSGAPVVPVKGSMQLYVDLIGEAHRDAPEAVGVCVTDLLLLSLSQLHSSSHTA